MKNAPVYRVALGRGGELVSRDPAPRTRGTIFSLSLPLFSFFCFFLFMPRGQGSELNDCHMKVVQWWARGGRNKAKLYSVCTHLPSTRTFAYALLRLIKGEGEERQYIWYEIMFIPMAVYWYRLIWNRIEQISLTRVLSRGCKSFALP
jgi:hypothetical protein